MGKFCIKCGKEIDENTKVCIGCGAQLDEKTPVAAVNRKSRLKKILIIAATVIVIIAAFLIYFLFIRSSYTDPLDNFCDAINKQDGEYVYDLMPEEVWEDITGKDDEDKIIKMLEKKLKEGAIANIEEELGSNVTMSYTVLDKTKLDSEDIEEYKEDSELDLSIEEAYNVCVKLEATGDDDSQVEYDSLIVVCIDGDWYSPQLAISYS